MKQLPKCVLQQLAAYVLKYASANEMKTDVFIIVADNPFLLSV